MQDGLAYAIALVMLLIAIFMWMDWVEIDPEAIPMIFLFSSLSIAGGTFYKQFVPGAMKGQATATETP